MFSILAAPHASRTDACFESAMKSGEDISLKMFLILAAGIALWVIYGVLGSGLITSS
jgi:hypothetical protein